jgi:heterodisulfide reductase subunit A
MDKCIACGLCAEKCPKKVPDEYDGGLSKRKAIYLKYAQAVPLKYAIDDTQCLYLTKGKCGLCAKVCPQEAIDYTQTATTEQFRVGAVVLAEGCSAFDPSKLDIYGYTRSPNIVTNMEFERILSASGPTGGHLVRPSDKGAPRKIAWIQCVGSRDRHKGANGYCSAVCCTAAIKEAMLAKEHCSDFLDTAIFYLDIRANGKNFEQYFNRAKDDAGVRFIKSKISEISPLDAGGRHAIRYVDEAGEIAEEHFDIVVLSVGLSANAQNAAMAEKMGLDLNHYRFVTTSSFTPVQTSRPGIYVCGSFQAPKDIPSSVIDSSAAAGAAGSRLAPARFTKSKFPEEPSIRETRGEPVRIGVFLCRCGTNIAGVVGMDRLEEATKSLPGVVYVGTNMFSCSQDTQESIASVIREKGINRVVVAACTPKTHEPLFQQTLTNAGINKYLFEMANIRNQCSWVHKADPEAATDKAIDLVRMAVAKVALQESLDEPRLAIAQSALVIGGGVAGLEAARNLGDQGYSTYLVEQSDRLGGKAWFLQQTWRKEDVHAYLRSTIQAVSDHPNITVLTNTRILDASGFVGNFTTTISRAGAVSELRHGVTIIATGAEELKPEMYLYGEDPRVLTRLDLHKKFIEEEASLARTNTAVLIQCVGSRIPSRPYCSKLCCTQTIKSSLHLRELNPDMNIYVLYRDMRPYGFQEDIFRQARESGIHFIRYCFEKPLSVTRTDNSLQIDFSDCVLRRKMRIHPDLLVLATAIVPEKKNALANMYKVSQDEYGFFSEAHVKLRPVDFATQGVFVCGLAHAPKPIDESIAQAQAAAARAVTLLAAKEISSSGSVAQVNPAYCVSCGVCVAVCPYQAPRIDAQSGKAVIQPSLCKGCGLCAAACRSGAIQLKGFTAPEIMAEINAFMDL